MAADRRRVGPYYVTFERISQDENSVPFPVAPSGKFDEAEAALMALGGFNCKLCGEQLEESKGYVCCKIVHCPFCGKMASLAYIFTWQGKYCEHLLACSGDFVVPLGRQRSGNRRKQRFIAEFVAINHDNREDWARWKVLRNLMPPALPLPAQKVKGFPQWSEHHKKACYGDLLPLLEPIFGNALRIIEKYRCSRLVRALLRHCLCPCPYVEISTLRLALDEYKEYYFSANTALAESRVEQVLTDIAEGTRQLRAIAPEKFIIRPVPKLKQEHRWEAWTKE